MYKWFVIALILSVATAVNAQQRSLDFRTVDSLSYSYYLKGEWNKLIALGNEALKADIDYKRLRQRIGYAYFLKQDYFAAKNQYEKALSFDQYDADTQVFLYYCGTNLGDEDYARYRGAKLSDDIKESLDLKRTRLIDAIDLEYNKKINNSNLRSNPIYARFGINTQLSYRLSLYQSVSNYSQAVVLNAPPFPGVNDAYWNAATKQSEYLISMKWVATPNTSILAGFHYLKTTVDSVPFGGKLYFGAFETKISRFRFGLNGSLLKNGMGSFKQYGISAGVVLPSKSNIYLNTVVKRLIEKNEKRTVFGQAIGGNIYRNVWAESNSVFGNIKNSNDNNSIYVYNFLDPNVFRESVTLFWNINSKVTFIANYSFDKKQYQNNTNSYYNQQSFLGGIRWKL